MEGTCKFHKDKKDKSNAEFFLRHNIHALEKGLCFRPLRKTFAIGYIRQTTEIYKSYTQYNVTLDEDEMNQYKWFTDILNKYFAVTESHPEIDAARKTFESVDLNFLDKVALSIPYKRKFGVKSSINYDEFLKLAKQRRSVRWFEQKSVPRELIDKALLAARLSPTACNRQPIKYRIFDGTDPSLLRKIVKLPMGTAGLIKTFLLWQ